MPELLSPDAVISLHPDRYAPRAARYFVATVDRPSPDLRDVVVLLTSELVTRTVLLCEDRGHELVELRIWMPRDFVRVELHAPRELVFWPPQPEQPQHDLLLIDDLADRWSIDADSENACMWFEIDRQQVARAGHDSSLRAELARHRD
jgi:hypothetical protein